MNKKLFCTIIISFIFINLWAQSFYAGINGNFVFSGKKDSATNSGFGGGFLLEGGINLGLFDFGLQGGFSKTSGDNLILSMTELQLGATTAIHLDNDVLKFLPEFICLKPEVVYFIDYFGAQHYRTESLKERGFLERTTGVSSQFTTDFSIMFPNVLKVGGLNIVPYTGYAFNMKFDESALIKTSNAFLGIRLCFNRKKDISTDINQIPETNLFSEESMLNVLCNFTNKSFTPDGNGYNDEAVFETIINDYKVDSWEFLVFDADKNLFYSEKGHDLLPDKIIWDGIGSSGEKVMSAATYQYVLMIESNGAKGVVPGVFNVDVFVTTKNGQLNIALPSISFSPDSADFTGLPENETIHNNQLLEQVVEILNEYSDYYAEISGHAHNVSGTEEENINELIPLSTARAQKILDELVKRGIDKNRLSYTGKGSDEPLAQNENEIWKNRRVEILLKK